MRFLLVLIVFLLTPHAIAAPPEVISPYAQKVIDSAEAQLTTISSSGSAGSCGAEVERHTIERVRLFFQEARKGFAAPAEDIARSVCHVHDIHALEIYVRDILDLAMQAAQSCNTGAAEEYVSVARFVWDSILRIRLYGIDPSVTAPISGDGQQPSNPTPTDDDGVCPYDSLYAGTGLADVGCHVIDLPQTATQRQWEEAATLNYILATLEDEDPRGLPKELQGLRGAMDYLWGSARAFVGGVHRGRPLTSPDRIPPTFVPRVQQNVGESGCLGWPTLTPADVVTGEDIPRISPFLPLTQELRETMAYLLEREDVRYYDYLQKFRSEAGDDTFEELALRSQEQSLVEINRKHLHRETALILSLRDPQQEFENLANSLHTYTRQFAAQAVQFPGQTDVPPLRQFARNYATFLSRMCINRGCTHNVVRAVELSMRNQCFSSFIQDHFFRDNPSATTLPACKAVFAQ